jgi:hypothetical protein
MAGHFFIPDVSAHQGELPNFSAVAADSRMVGCIIKATQGVTYAPSWFTVNWPRVTAAGGSRYGKSWFRGCFHFATPTPSGTAQADYLLKAVERAGGWGDGDMPPAWDLEGSAWTSRQQIVDVSSQFAERIKQQLGKAPILYTGAVWRSFGVKEKAGFTKLWTTHMDKMALYGWPNSSVVLHQYVGTGKYYNPASAAATQRYPTGVSGLAATADMNVVMDGGTPATSIERVRQILTGSGGTFARGGRGVSMPIMIGVGAGLLALGIMITSAGHDELV